MEYSPKLIRRWAHIYIEKLDNDGKEAAVEWANRFVPKDVIPQIQREIKRIRAGE